MNYAPGVDLVVVNYQTSVDLHRFLTSFEQAEIEIPNTLHVVNVCPQDGDQRVVEYFADLGLRFLYSKHEENVGYAKACNAAARFPDREVVAFFNADTELRPGVVERCHRELQEPHVGVVGPKQVNDAGRLTSAGIFGTNERPKLRGWQEVDRGQYDDVQDCVSVSGSAYFVRRDVWDALTSCELFAPYGAEGAFLPTQHYYEETYLSHHAAHHGWFVRYVGDVGMIHRWHQASAVGEVESRYMRASQALFRSACDAHGIGHE